MQSGDRAHGESGAVRGLEHKYGGAVESVVQEFISDSNSGANLAQYYSDNSCFSIMFPKANKGSPLSKLFGYNHNFGFLRDGAPTGLRGAKEITQTQRKLFPGGIQMRDAKFAVQLVSALFFTVNIEGTTVVEGSEYKFNRSMIILEEKGYFVISNDIFVFRIH